MKDLKELLGEMTKRKAIVAREIPDDFRTTGVHLGNRRRAEEDLSELRGDFYSELTKKALFIVPEGTDEEQTAFAEQAAKLGCFVYDADSFVDNLVKDINPAIYKNQPLNMSVLGQVSYELEILAESAGISAFNQLVLKNNTRSVTDKESLKSNIAKLFEEQVGNEFMGLVAVKQLTDEAINAEFTGKVFPVVLTRTNKFKQETLRDLGKMNAPVYDFKLADKLTDTYVKGVLKEARKVTGK